MKEAFNEIVMLKAFFREKIRQHIGDVVCLLAKVKTNKASFHGWPRRKNANVYLEF